MADLSENSSEKDFVESLGGKTLDETFAEWDAKIKEMENMDKPDHDENLREWEEARAGFGYPKGAKPAVEDAASAGATEEVPCDGDLHLHHLLQESMLREQRHHAAYLELEKFKAEVLATRGKEKLHIGFLNVIQSCMFGGKTTHLIHLLDSYSRSGECLYVNHSLDTRSDEGYSTHNEYLNSELSARLSQSRVTMRKVSMLSELPDEFLKRFRRGAVCIDEAQFFPDLVPSVLRMVEELGIETVCVAGLTLTFKRQPFGHLLHLSGHADHITLLRDTPCNPCAARGKRRVAIYSHLQKERSTSDEEIQIGADQYLPVCRKCYLEMNS